MARGDNIKDVRSGHPYRKHSSISLNLESSTLPKDTFIQLSLNDIKFLANENVLNNINAVPRLQVTEFQSNYQFNWALKLNDLLNSILAGIGEIGSAGNSLTATNPELDSFKIDDLKLNEELAKINSSNNSILDRPVQMIKEMFTGKYVGSYEIPYWQNNETFINISNGDKWNVKGEAGQSEIGKSIKEYLNKGANVDYPTIPTWSLKDGATVPADIAVKFSLYNDNLSNLMKNFKFVHTITSGAFWVQDNYRQMQPNLYDVHFPGYFQYYYCSMDIQVKLIGMKRKLQLISLDKLRGVSGINIPDNTFFPDMYYVEITFKPLVPNNFNMYLNYLIKGPDKDTKTGGIRQSQLQRIFGEDPSLAVSKLTDLASQVATTSFNKNNQRPR